MPPPTTHYEPLIVPRITGSCRGPLTTSDPSIIQERSTGSRTTEARDHVSRETLRGSFVVSRGAHHGYATVPCSRERAGSACLRTECLAVLNEPRNVIRIAVTKNGTLNVSLVKSGHVFHVKHRGWCCVLHGSVDSRCGGSSPNAGALNAKHRALLAPHQH